MNKPKFEIFSDKKGKVRFRLKASNGKVVIQSEGYDSKRNAMDTIHSIIQSVKIAEIVYIEHKSKKAA